MKRHQVKSKWYYVFWGIATVSVVIGQVYVGTGYRLMAQSMFHLTDVLTGPPQHDNATVNHRRFGSL